MAPGSGSPSWRLRPTWPERRWLGPRAVEVDGQCPLSEEGAMSSAVQLLDAAGRRRSPATLPEPLPAASTSTTTASRRSLYPGSRQSATGAPICKPHVTPAVSRLARCGARPAGTAWPSCGVEASIYCVTLGKSGAEETAGAGAPCSSEGRLGFAGVQQALPPLSAACRSAARAQVPSRLQTARRRVAGAGPPAARLGSFAGWGNDASVERSVVSGFATRRSGRRSSRRVGLRRGDRCGR